ncbi:MAG: long-chain fatty acid--CoA ligase [Candidatus Velthaea sp.]
MMRSARLRERIEQRAMGLRAAGVGRGDRVAMMSPNRIDWIVTSLAVLFAGGVTVPIYATQAHDQVRHILMHSGAKLLVVDAPALRDALAASGVQLPRTISFDGEGDGTARAVDDVGRLAAAAEPGALDAIAATVAPDDLAVLIYTSGTTGVPKGVMLSHSNIVSNVVDPYPLLEDVVRPGDPVLSVLPYAHIYESTNVFGYFLHEGTIYVNRGIDALLQDLREVRPVLMFGVPRIFERMLAAIRARARAQGGLRARLVPWALDAGRKYMEARGTRRHAGLGCTLGYRIARALVLRKIPTLLGLDRLAWFGSGSAPLHPDTAWTFLGFGVRIVEGYGLTECSPVVTAAHPDRAIVGTVGPPIANVEVKLAADGELLVRGPNVMKGYYHDDAATSAAIVDGWLQTIENDELSPTQKIKRRTVEQRYADLIDGLFSRAA